jgi:hypothetical protein
MNCLVISGYLTRPPEQGKGFCKLSLINKDCKLPVKLEVLVFGKQGAQSYEYLEKGRFCEIKGRIEQGRKGLQYVGDEVTFGDKPRKEKKDITDEDF